MKSKVIFKETEFMRSRKLIVFAFALFTVCLFGEIPCRAQTKQSNVLYAEPARFMLKGDGNADKETGTAALLREQFYPIGWSKDGKFAYYVEPADEACGCYFGELVIQDMRMDKILWQRDYNSDGKPEDTLKKYWAKNRKEFSRKLAQYGIVAQKRFTLQNSKINYQKDVLIPEIKVNTAVDNEDKVAGNVLLQLISKQRGRKTIYEKKFDPKKYEGFRGAETAGGLLSPFEPRAAIIMVETYRGWEGPPNITQIRIVGTSLTTGFR
jgi:hypothetical protein